MARPVAALWRLWAVLRCLCGWILPDLQPPYFGSINFSLSGSCQTFFIIGSPAEHLPEELPPPVVPCGDFSPVVVHEKKFLRSHGLACGPFSGRLSVSFSRRVNYPFSALRLPVAYFPRLCAQSERLRLPDPSQLWGKLPRGSVPEAVIHK